MARGFYHYWGELDYESAHPRVRGRAAGMQPSNSELLQAIGYVERRRGRWEESLARFVEALRYDPALGHPQASTSGDNYFSLRMFGEADHYLDRAMTLSPDWPNPYIYRAWLHVAGGATWPRARAIIATGPQPDRGRPLRDRRSRPATGCRPRSSPPTAPSGRCSTASRSQTFTGDTVRYHLLKAEAATSSATPAAERAHGDSARVLIEPRDRSAGRRQDARDAVARLLAYGPACRGDPGGRASRGAAADLAGRRVRTVHRSPTWPGCTWPPAGRTRRSTSSSACSNPLLDHPRRAARGPHLGPAPLPTRDSAVWQEPPDRFQPIETQLR